MTTMQNQQITRCARKNRLDILARKWYDNTLLWTQICCNIIWTVRVWMTAMGVQTLKLNDRVIEPNNSKFDCCSGLVVGISTMPFETKNVCSISKPLLHASGMGAAKHWWLWLGCGKHNHDLETANVTKSKQLFNWTCFATINEQVIMWTHLRT